MVELIIFQFFLSEIPRRFQPSPANPTTRQAKLYYVSFLFLPFVEPLPFRRAPQVKCHGKNFSHQIASAAVLLPLSNWRGLAGNPIKTIWWSVLSNFPFGSQAPNSASEATRH